MTDTGQGRLQIFQGVCPVRARQVPRELVAGITLAALAIPEVMGYTRIAGTPVVTGLYTMLVPAALFAVFGGSRHLVVGADSATAAILAAGLVGLAATGSAEYTALAALLALMAAGFLILARLVGIAFMADFLSRTVLIGFLSGVGVQVALSEVPGMLGLHGGGGPGSIFDIWDDVRRLEQVNGYALGMAVAVLALIVGSRSLSPRLPGALLAVAGAITASWLLDLSVRLPVLGAVPGGLPVIGLPQVDWSLDLIRRLAPTAFAMFVVILAQSAATSRAYAARYAERFSENTDLLGLGIANVGAGLSGTFVVNGSPTKTQMVDDAGGRSQLSMLVMSTVVLVVLLFLTEPLAHLPESALSAVVFLIGIQLVDLRGLRRVFEQRRSEFWVALATGLMVVIVGVEQGILLAIVLSLVDHTRRGYRPRNALLQQGRSGTWQIRPVSSRAQALPGLLVYRFSHSMYYANAQLMADEIIALAGSARPPVRWLCIEMSAVDDIDFSAAETLAVLRRSLEERGIRLIAAQLLDDPDPRARERLSGIFGDGAVYDGLANVVRGYLEHHPADATSVGDSGA